MAPSGAVTTLDFDQFDVLTFDCYGTLIDWEAGILAALRAPLAAHGVEASDDAMLEAFARHEAEVEAGPYQRVSGGPRRGARRRCSADFGAEPSPDEVAAFGGSVTDWPAFPDSAGRAREASRPIPTRRDHEL